MIQRAVYDTIKNLLGLKPAVLITGARQVGKTTLCGLLKKEMGIGYVTLADSNERQLAVTDPEMFIKVHGYPLIIDEIQYAPGLFETIESVIDRERFSDPDAHGLFVLTGSQKYRLMEGVTQTMSGRVGIIDIPPISLSEEFGLQESPFAIDPEASFRRSSGTPDGTGMLPRIVRGMYPEIMTKKKLSPQRFYSDYVESYIMRDVSEIINIRDRQKFRLFMEVVASLTGQVLSYETVSKAVSVDSKTVRSWLSILEAGDIITLLEPYSDRSVAKRVSKRPKIYMKDTGLACYLAKVPDEKILSSSYLRGPMAETFMINEIMKTHSNRGLETPFFYYRDSNGNEVDLVMLYGGKLNMIECKSGISYGPEDIKAFGRLPTDLEKDGCIICMADAPYPVTKDVYAIPLKTVGYRFGGVPHRRTGPPPPWSTGRGTQGGAAPGP